MVMSIFRLLGLTGILRLVTKLMLDRRVPLRLKLIIPAALVYLVSPIDTLPDLVPLLGHVDDLIVTVVALALFLALAPRDVVLEHFRGRRGGEPVDTGARKDRENVIEGQYRYVEDDTEGRS